MSENTFIVAPGARVPLSLLSTEEKERLASLVLAPAQSGAERTAAGHFVARLGNDKRVLFEQRAGSPAIILSIVDRSYKAA